MENPTVEGKPPTIEEITQLLGFTEVSGFYGPGNNLAFYLVVLAYLIDLLSWFYNVWRRPKPRIEPEAVSGAYLDNDEINPDDIEAAAATSSTGSENASLYTVGENDDDDEAPDSDHGNATCASNSNINESETEGVPSTSLATEMQLQSIVEGNVITIPVTESIEATEITVEQTATELRLPSTGNIGSENTQDNGEEGEGDGETSPFAPIETEVSDPATSTNFAINVNLIIILTYFFIVAGDANLRHARYTAPSYPPYTPYDWSEYGSMTIAVATNSCAKLMALGVLYLTCCLLGIASSIGRLRNADQSSNFRGFCGILSIFLVLTAISTVLLVRRRDREIDNSPFCTGDFYAINDTRSERNSLTGYPITKILHEFWSSEMGTSYQGPESWCEQNDPNWPTFNRKTKGAIPVCVLVTAKWLTLCTIVCDTQFGHLPHQKIAVFFTNIFTNSTSPIDNYITLIQQKGYKIFNFIMSSFYSLLLILGGFYIGLYGISALFAEETAPTLHAFPRLPLNKEIKYISLTPGSLVDLDQIFSVAGGLISLIYSSFCAFKLVGFRETTKLPPFFKDWWVYLFHRRQNSETGNSQPAFVPEDGISMGNISTAV